MEWLWVEMMIGFFVGRMYMRWYRINVSCCHVKGVSWGGGIIANGCGLRGDFWVFGAEAVL